MKHQLIDTAPKDGSIITAIKDTATEYSFCNCVWKNGKWVEIIHKTIEHPTHWKPYK